MPIRVSVAQRVVCAVGVAVEAKWVICLPGVGVFGQKPCGCAVVIAGIQVVQPTLAVILVSCIGDAVIGIPVICIFWDIL